MTKERRPGGTVSGGGRWAGIDAEIEGVRKAARNTAPDVRKLAEYVYDRASAYVGPMHRGVTVDLIAAAIAAPERAP